MRDSKNSKFIKEKKPSGLLSSLEKTPLSKFLYVPLVALLLFQ